jgi:hypothetical protein
LEPVDGERPSPNWAKMLPVLNDMLPIVAS